MEDTYVYISVKICLEPGQTEESIQEIVQDMDCSFDHPQIVEHEIVDILDSQIPEKEEDPYCNDEYVDPFDSSGLMGHGE